MENMGGLHIHMTLLIVLGHWLDGSGWVNVMMAANITTDRRGGALKKGSFTANNLVGSSSCCCLFLLA